MKEYRVTPTDRGVRIDVFVSAKYPNFTRSAVAQLFRNKLVSINNIPSRSGIKIKEKDIIRVDDTLLFTAPEEVNLSILYEDDDVVVINKPAGMLTHSKGALNTEATVASFIKNKITDKNLSGNRAGIVHRLDRSTSGLIITAKNTRSLKWLQQQFSQRKVKKIYHAIIEGWPRHNTAVIDASIRRNPKKPQIFGVDKAGKQAQTQYSVIKKFTKNNHKYSKIELVPTTGRTHQLRVHLSYIGHPIVGDPLYGKSGDDVYLHAKSLELKLPNKTFRRFNVSTPKKFINFMKNE